MFVSGPPEQAALRGRAGVGRRRRRAPLRLRAACGRAALAASPACARSPARSGTVSTNWTPERTELEADVGRLAAAGAEGLALYNLSLVPAAGLEAFRAAAHAFRGAVVR